MYALPRHCSGVFLEVVLKTVLASPFELQHSKSATDNPTGSGVWLPLTLSSFEVILSTEKFYETSFPLDFPCRFAGV